MASKSFEAAFEYLKRFNEIGARQRICQLVRKKQGLQKRDVTILFDNEHDGSCLDTRLIGDDTVYEAQLSFQEVIHNTSRQAAIIRGDMGMSDGNGLITRPHFHGQHP